MLSLALPRRTWAHDIPASVKLLVLFAVSAALVPVRDITILALALGMVALLTISLGRVAVRRSKTFVAGLSLMLLLVMGYHLYTDDVNDGLVIVFRLLTLVLLANFVTMTTPLARIMGLLETVLRPLSRRGLNTRAFSVAVGLVIRFTPVLIQGMGQLREAWRVRSCWSPGWRLIGPLGLMILDDAGHVADALRARGGIIRPQR